MQSLDICEAIRLCSQDKYSERLFQCKRRIKSLKNIIVCLLFLLCSLFNRPHQHGCQHNHQELDESEKLTSTTRWYGRGLNHKIRSPCETTLPLSYPDLYDMNTELNVLNPVATSATSFYTNYFCGCRQHYNQTRYMLPSN